MPADRIPEPRRIPRVVRPYVLTRGRTKGPGATLALEAQVQATVTPARLDRRATPEARRMVELCQEPISIAEMAARLVLPVGVVRVLVGDLAATGVVTVGASSDGANDVALLRRLLDGIRAL